MEQSEQGRILVITGDGKGKTTSALGLSLRAVGHRKRVLFLQFIKADMSGERLALPFLTPWLEIQAVGAGFVFPDRPEEMPRHRQAAAAGFDMAQRALASGQWQMLVLDEIFPAVSLGLVPLPKLLILIREKPYSLHLVLTGRDAPTEVIDLADTVSEVREIKHAFHLGISAQRGIEFR
jgi:cob(I)alamin adenosyltransferase